MIIKNTLILGLLIGLIFTLLPQAVFAADRQQWFADDVEDETPGWADYIMYWGAPLDELFNYLPIPAGESITWRSDVPAPSGFTFGAGEWQYKIMMETGSSYTLGNIYIRIGYVNASGFTMEAETTLAGGTGNTWNIDKKFDADSFDIPPGAYMGLQIYNGTSGTINVGAGYTHNWLKSPVVDPDYPVPEIPTIALFGIGIVCLGGYLVIRKRRAEYH